MYHQLRYDKKYLHCVEQQLQLRMVYTFSMLNTSLSTFMISTSCRIKNTSLNKLIINLRRMLTTSTIMLNANRANAAESKGKMDMKKSHQNQKNQALPQIKLIKMKTKLKTT